jgi:hypothetical protein
MEGVARRIAEEETRGARERLALVQRQQMQTLQRLVLVGRELTMGCVSVACRGVEQRRGVKP